MSFNASLNRARDTTLPIGARYLGLLGALERGHRGYQGTWAILKAKFGVGIRDEVSSETLLAIADFLTADRQQWLISHKEAQAQVRLNKRRKRHGS